jgi:hypothetical protein
MKRTLLLSLCILSYSVISAQIEKPQNLRNYDKETLHFGFSVGLSTADFTLRNSDDFFNTNSIDQIYAIENTQSPGFQLGPLSSLRLGEYFELRLLVYLTFAQRNLQYYILKDTSNGNFIYDNHEMKISSTFLEFPLQLKYRSVRINNVRPYIIAGINPKIDLSAQKKIPETEMPKIRLKRENLYYEMGVGINFYTPYFKFSPEIKYSVGLFNMLEPDNTQYTSSIKYLRSNMLMLSFHFQ